MSRAFPLALALLVGCGGERLQGIGDAGSDAGPRAPAPTDVPRVDARGAYQAVALDWVVDGAGPPIDHYRVYSAAQSFTKWSPSLTQAEAHDATCCEDRVGGLTPDVTYYFAVAAVNDGGEGPRSEVVSAVPGAYGLDWQRHRDLPVPRYDLGLAAIDGKVYAVGGDTGSVVPLVDVYDPATDAWSACAPLPGPRAGALVVVVDGLLYVLGGRTDDGPVQITYDASVLVYDPAANAWAARQPIPGGGGPIAGAAVGHTIEVLTAQHLVYDTVADSWSAPAPLPITPGSAASWNGTLYALSATAFDELDGASGNWIGLPLPNDPGTPSQQIWPQLAVAGTTLVVYGRVNTGVASWTEGALFYDPAQAQPWRALSFGSEGRDNPGVAAEGNRLFVVGGRQLSGSNALPVPLGTFEIAQAQP